MSWTGMSVADQAGVLVACVLTLCVFSYWLRDSVLFRLAIHVFIGVAAAYAAVVVWYNVLWPQLILPLFSGDWQAVLLSSVPLVMGVLLLLKLSPRLPKPGRLTLAFLVGVGAALAIGGAVTGTIVPQALASINLFDEASLQTGGSDRWVTLINQGIILIGTLTSLAYFHFGARRGNSLDRANIAERGSPETDQAPTRPVWIEEAAGVGQVFIAVTLGALFAGAYAAALAALVERLDFIVQLIRALLER